MWNSSTGYSNILSFLVWVSSSAMKDIVCFTDLKKLYKFIVYTVLISYTILKQLI